jgi:ABC-2 type transport system ATP-binding protein
MIEVTHLTKRYPGRTAVNDISFSVAKGEVVGFLGPNGAGKSTTMRVLSGYLPASGGDVKVAGMAVMEHSLEVRRHIGYLPESCPLYAEMRVNEYLGYRARLKGLRGKKLRHRVAIVKELCGLGDMGRRILGQLSKGYRQRVGLADALVHKPDLLILDEPTIGLDPNQIKEIRHLIGDLAQDHTILLSTHILSEVEATCQRVLILKEGKIVASDTPANLADVLTGGAQVVADIKGSRSDILSQCHALPGVTRVTVLRNEAWVRVELHGGDGEQVREGVFAMVVRNQWHLRELTAVRRNLEDVFGALTLDRTEGEEP